MGISWFAASGVTERVESMCVCLWVSEGFLSSPLCYQLEAPTTPQHHPTLYTPLFLWQWLPWSPITLIVVLSNVMTASGVTGVHFFVCWSHSEGGQQWFKERKKERDWRAVICSKQEWGKAIISNKVDNQIIYSFCHVFVFIKKYWNSLSPTWFMWIKTWLAYSV